MCEKGILIRPNFENLRNKMIHKLTKTDAHFKHQQRGEPDLSDEEKSVIALDILNKSPVLFLERFSKYLTLEDAEYFKDLKGDYQVDFYIDEISRSAALIHNVVKNRRFRALQELMDEGEYFSEVEMKWRDPLLYEQMIGQYTSESEKEIQMEQDIDKSDLRFSTILLKHMDMQANKKLYETLKEREEEQEEEEEYSDDDDDCNESTELTKAPDSKHSEIGTKMRREINNDSFQNADRGLMEMEKNYFRGEFLRIMQEKFLSGEDANFDYSKVDSNADYDCLDIVGHDAEEKYFDAGSDDDCFYRTSSQKIGKSVMKEEEGTHESTEGNKDLKSF